MKATPEYYFLERTHSYIKIVAKNRIQDSFYIILQREFPFVKVYMYAGDATFKQTITEYRNFGEQVSEMQFNDTYDSCAGCLKRARKI